MSFVKHQRVFLSQYTECAYTGRHDLTKEDFYSLKDHQQLRLEFCDGKWVFVRFRCSAHPENDSLGWSRNEYKVLLTDVFSLKEEDTVAHLRERKSGYEDGRGNYPSYEERNPQKETYPGWGGYYNN